MTAIASRAQRRLASWIMENCPDEIGKDKPEGPVDVAVRLMQEALLQRKSHKPEPIL